MDNESMHFQIALEYRNITLLIQKHSKIGRPRKSMGFYGFLGFFLSHLLHLISQKTRAVPSGIPMTSRCLGPTVQESWKSIVWLDSARKGLRSPKRPGADSRYCLGSAGNQTWKHHLKKTTTWAPIQFIQNFVVLLCIIIWVCFDKHFISHRIKSADQLQVICPVVENPLMGCC